MLLPRHALPTAVLAAVLASPGCFIDQADDGGRGSAATETATATTSTQTTDASTTSTSTSTSTTGESATTTAADPLCGDGNLDPGEACDDGDLDPGDGCSPTCTVEPPPLRIFVSELTIDGAQGMIDAVDAGCQSEADAYRLGGVYFAWLSTNNITQPITRFAPHDRAYVLPGPDAPLVAIGLADLASGLHEHEINRGPSGVELAAMDGCQAAALVWTGTNNDGTAHVDTCASFTSADPAVNGRAGRYSGKGLGWSSQCSISCDSMMPVYCVEQP